MKLASVTLSVVYYYAMLIKFAIFTERNIKPHLTLSDVVVH